MAKPVFDLFVKWVNTFQENAHVNESIRREITKITERDQAILDAYSTMDQSHPVVEHFRNVVNDASRYAEDAGTFHVATKSSYKRVLQKLDRARTQFTALMIAPGQRN